MKFLFDGSVLLVHSKDDLYYKEKHGSKRNTVRILDISEMSKVPCLDTIRISLSDGDSNEFFTRKISDVSVVGHLLGKKMVVFSWDSDKGA